MLLNEIVIQEADGFEANPKLVAAKKELAAAKAAASAYHQGSSAPLKARVDKAKAAVDAIKQELNAKQKAPDAEKAARESDKAIAAKKAAETPEEKKQRFAKAVSDGQRETKELNAGDDEDAAGLAVIADKVYAYVKKASNNGAERVTGADIAHQFNKPVSSVNRWLRRPEFTKTARLLGRR